VKIGGGTGTAVLDEFLLCFRLDPILLSMMDLSTKRIMSMQIVIPGSALCLVTTGCVDVIELSTLVLTSFMVLASCIAGPLWLVVVIYVIYYNLLLQWHIHMMRFSSTITITLLNSNLLS